MPSEKSTKVSCCEVLCWFCVICVYVAFLVLVYIPGKLAAPSDASASEIVRTVTEGLKCLQGSKSHSLRLQKGCAPQNAAEKPCQVTPTIDASKSPTSSSTGNLRKARTDLPAEEQLKSQVSMRKEHRVFASRLVDVTPEDICLKTTLYRLEEPKGHMGFMTYTDFLTNLERLPLQITDSVLVTVDGFPCVERGCCRHTLRIRPLTSDMVVLNTAINEYAVVMVRLLPWAPKTILDGGGNIGVATCLLAFMYPDAKIFVLEPEPSNCALLKENTKRFRNVVIECKGLWSVANVSLSVVATDGQPWGFQTHELSEDIDNAVMTTSVPDLLARYDLPGFDFLKIDIETAEFRVFGENEDLYWLKQAHLMAIEIHGTQHMELLVNNIRSRGLVGFTHGEYTFFATPQIALALGIPP